MIYNISSDSQYQSQRKNKDKPRYSCNTTSLANALFSTGIEWKWPEGMTPADYLMSQLESDETFKEFYKRFPDQKKNQTFNPWNTSVMLTWMINNLIGRNVDKIEICTIEDILNHILLTKGAAVVSGEFFAGGHFVCVVGMESDETEEEIFTNEGIAINKVKKIIIDDPYGDFHSKYSNIDGNNVGMTIQEFLKIIYTQDKDEKRTQLFTKNQWV